MAPALNRRHTTRGRITLTPSRFGLNNPFVQVPVIESSASQPTRRCATRSATRSQATPYSGSDTVIGSALSLLDTDEESEVEEEGEEFEDADMYGSDDEYIDELEPELEDDTFIMEVTAAAAVVAVPKATATATAIKINIPVPVSDPTPAPIHTAPIAPAPAPATNNATGPSTLASNLGEFRALLDVHGKAVLRCALDHTPATADKHENDIAKAYQAVIEFHLSTIHEVQQTSSKIDNELARRLLNASTTIGDLRQEVIDKSKEIASKDGEAKIQQAVLDDLRYLNAVALKDNLAAEAKLAKIQIETEAKRKRVEDSISKASKKANL